jgi:uncharacterized protein (DUF2252 family)
VFDLNDFDEVTFGPWEFDLKRLVACVNVAGRENGLNAKQRREAVMRCVEIKGPSLCTCTSLHWR